MPPTCPSFKVLTGFLNGLVLISISYGALDHLHELLLCQQQLGDTQ